MPGRIREKALAASITPAAKPRSVFCVRSSSAPPTMTGKAPIPDIAPAIRLAPVPTTTVGRPSARLSMAAIMRKDRLGCRSEKDRPHGRSLPQRRSAVSRQHAAQHPGVLFVHLHALSQEVGGRLVIGLFDGRKDGARGASHRLLSSDELPDHVLG